MIASVVIVVVVLLLGAMLLYRSVRRVPRQTAEIVERFGRYHRTLGPESVSMVVPLIDQIRARVDLREQVIAFPPKPVVLSDDSIVQIDWVIHFEVIDAKAAVYNISNFLFALEQLSTTAVRAIGTDMRLEQISATRNEINTNLRETIDENANNWGLRVHRVELQTIEEDSPRT